jgi:hypothetical protein
MVVVIRAQVRGQTIRMLVDTGAANHYVFRGGPVIWLPKNEGSLMTTRHLGGGSRSGEVSLRTLSIGSNEWKELKAMAISNPKPDSWDSILSVGSLGLKRIYFDFEHQLLSWAR